MNNYTKAVLVASLCAAFAVGGAALMSPTQAASDLADAASLTSDNNFTGTVNQFPSVKIGKQGVGGVTFFNGTIINVTTDEDGNENPVTFGDDVRIDGSVWRGADSGPDDSQAFTIDDNAEITGDLTLGGELDVTSEITMETDQYLQLGTRSSAPPASDCNEDSEIGRAILDTSPAGSNITLWGCKGSDGWTSVTF